MPANLVKKLLQYKNQNNYPFHMPGHKQRKGLFSETGILEFDITEIPGFDNLNHPEGLLLEAQNSCAKTFGAEETFFLVNGSSGGLMAAILSISTEGECVLTARNCHRSVYHGLVFSGARPVYFMPEAVEDYGLSGGVTPKAVETLLSENKDAKGVILTSPTFEGFTSDIREIAKIVHRYNCILIVDEAHGAHMKFHSFFPATALEQGADIVIQSVHKTLPCLTQTALLHVQGQRVNRARLRQMLSMIQTSSPSYLFMASIDSCRDALDEKAEEYFENYVARLKKLRKELSCLKKICLLGEELCGKFGISGFDYSKLDFFVDAEHYSGVWLVDILFKKYGIQLEMGSLHHAVAMTTISDTQEGFDRLKNALFELDSLLVNEKSCKSRQIDKISLNGEGMTPREAVFAKKQKKRLEEAVGFICGEFVIPYPPGIPLIVPGEPLTENVLRCIRKYQNKGIAVIGTKDTKCDTLEIIESKANKCK